MKINSPQQVEVVDIEATEVNSIANAPKTFVSNAPDGSARANADEHLHNVVLPQLSADGMWRIKRTPATFRRIQKLKLSDAEVTEMLKNHITRSQFGYSYLEKVYQKGKIKQDGAFL